ncbi:MULTISPECIES: hypothetical protein [unclassified Actinoplanes]|uniref:hypothetical protein n=1 Tax=unclassified Actinoplanes TaxID=2626549 RepID=UPI0006933FE8|nr:MULTISPECIES: hypothetical protein [unclassified Actinoplanes]
MHPQIPPSTGRPSHGAQSEAELAMIAASHHYRSDFARCHFAEGWINGRAQARAKTRAQGKAESILTVLDVRGIETPESFRERLMACTDEALLGRLIRQASTVEQLDDLDSLDSLDEPEP